MRVTRTILLLAALGTASVPVAADVIVDWNNVTLDAVRESRTNPPLATRALAMVHLAMFDAVNGIEGGHRPYLVHRPAPPRAMAEAAAAYAAHAVLSHLYPDLQDDLDTALDQSLADLPSGPELRQSLAFGRYCGRTLLRERAHDGPTTTWTTLPPGNSATGSRRPLPSLRHCCRSGRCSSLSG
jgi:hypothetical protein